MAIKFPIEYKTIISKLQHLTGMRYVEVPPVVVKKLGGKFSMRLICTLHDTLSFQCGMMALGKGSAYITVTLKRMKQLGLKDGDEVKVSLQPDKSKYGMEVPVELKELLHQDKEGKKRFDLLTPGRQRYIIHYVSTVKSSQLRIERAILLIENLKKLPFGKESFREMLGLEKRG